MSAQNSASRITFDRAKFLAAVHYVIDRKTDDPDSLGKTKLHKCLYYADMLKFVDRGEPLTGVEYRKAPFGPTARYLDWALKMLKADGKIAFGTTRFYGLQKFNFSSKQRVNSNSLDAYDRSLLDEMIAFVCGFSAKEISEISHAKPWQSAKMGETITYSSAFLLLPALTPNSDEIAWANERAAAGVVRK